MRAEEEAEKFLKFRRERTELAESERAALKRSENVTTLRKLTLKDGALVTKLWASK